ncbi:MAG TPA: hypothetical protein VK849_08425, partial [Longimicrobiales bacterium]|nr:hypothetical protein [Longimicrobiales bacterium]
GLGAVLRAGVEGYGSGTIHMAVGPSGYVGLVRLEDGALNVAAALDPEALRGPSGPAEPVAALLDGAGLPVPDGLAAADWHGTPPLTWRPRRLGGDRVFRVGDAAGYVEPFTGEGMCWALGGARALAPIAASAAARWDVSLLRRWEHVHRRGIGRAQRLCKAAAWTLRRPALARLVLVALGVVPELASPFVRVASAPPPPTLSPTP